MMNSKDILIKLASGEATKSEIENFGQWAKTLSIEAYENLLLEYESVVAEQNTGTDFNSGLLQKIHEQIRAEEEEHSAKEVVMESTNRRGKWWMAAAAVIVLAGLSYFLVLNNKNEPQLVVAKNGMVTNDIAPGGNKAILTLADGTKLVLDAANNGAITKQGNVTVIKLDDGLLSYQKASGKEAEVVYNTISTPRGGQYQLVLSDGSKVWLNAASSIKFPNIFSGNDRRVELTGEGYFEVAHNEKKPFYVKVRDMEVKVLGTHFNVNAYEDEKSIKTTLLEGKVVVIYKSERKTIVPGEQAGIQYNGEGTINVAKVNVNAAVAWKNGLFQFTGANMSEVMRQIGRWYDMDVNLKGNIKAVHISGKAGRSLSLLQMVKVLEESGIDIQLEGREITAAPKP